MGYEKLTGVRKKLIIEDSTRWICKVAVRLHQNVIFKTHEKFRGFFALCVIYQGSRLFGWTLKSRAIELTLLNRYQDNLCQKNRPCDTQRRGRFSLAYFLNVVTDDLAKGVA